MLLHDAICHLQLGHEVKMLSRSILKSNRFRAQKTFRRKNHTHVGLFKSPIARRSTHITPQTDMDREVCNETNLPFTLGPHLAHIWYRGPYFPNQSWIWESSTEDESGPQMLLKVVRGRYWCTSSTSPPLENSGLSVKSCHCKVVSFWDLSYGENYTLF